MIIMLSIEITDARIALLGGFASGKKITMRQTASREIGKGYVENGYIKKIHELAGEITELLRIENITDKKATVIINSGLILFKECLLPKPRKYNRTELIERMIRNEMKLTDDYNFTFTVIREEEKDGRKLLRLTAAACPQSLVDSYTDLFHQLGIKLTGVFISSTCLARYVDTGKLSDKMPMVTLQLDPRFVNINLFEDDRLSLNRFVKADPNDYEPDADYINLTVFDNLFRIINLYGQNNSGSHIENVYYHGYAEDLHSIETNIAQFNLPVARLPKTDNVIYRGDDEFTEYAALAGSLPDINKRMENINLLHSQTYRNIMANLNFLSTAITVMIICVGVVLGANVFTGQLLEERNHQLNALRVEYQLLRPDEIARHNLQLQSAVGSFTNYTDKVKLSETLFDFQPKMLPSVMTMLEKVLLDNMSISGVVSVNSYNVTATFKCTNDKQPTRYTEELEADGFFENIVFTGYTKNSDNDYTFTLSMKIKGGNKFEAE